MKKEVFEVVSMVMNTPVDEITEDSTPETVEEWDSLKHMRLILVLEEKFGVQFTDTQIMAMMSVKDILNTLHESMG